MKKILSMVSALAAGALFAAEVPNVEVVTFSTVGPDTYADGTTVLDGECYALVWSADGAFDGIAANGTAVDANDKVLAILPFAEGGKCPTVVYNVSADLVSGGVFDVYLCDTRATAADGTVTVGKRGTTVAVNAAAKAATATVTSAAGGTGTFAEAKTTGTVAATGVTALPTDVPQPKITNIALDGDNVILEVENTVGYINYVAQGGKTVAADETVGAAQVGAEGKKIYLVAPKSDAGAGFFKVNRK